jgi:hypothetical protein
MNSIEVFRSCLEIIEAEKRANAGDALTAALLQRIQNRILNEVHPRPFVPPPPPESAPPPVPAIHGGGRE